jgi:Tol biopolymer transport system component
VTFDVASGKREVITEPGRPNIPSFTWLPDGRGLIVTTAPGSGRSFQVFFVPYPQGQPSQITNDLDNYSDVSISAEGTSIAALRTSRDSSLWLVPAEENGAARQITSRSSTDGIGNILPLEGGSISFTANKDRHRPVWIVAQDGGGRQQITSQAGWSWSLFPLPGGRGVVFNHTSEAEPKAHVWRVDVDGGNLRQVTDGSGESLTALSPDGQTVLFTRTEFPKVLWRVSLDGEEPEKFLDPYDGSGQYSPDGRFFLHTDLEEIEGRQRSIYVIMPAEGGEPLVRFLPPGGAFDFEWYPDGSGLTYTHTVEGVQNLWRQPVDGSDPVQLTHFTEGRIPDHKHSSEGARIVLERIVGDIHNVWTIKSDGTGPVQITDFRSGVIFDTKWARDGDSLVVLQGDVRREVVLLEQ